MGFSNLEFVTCILTTDCLGPRLIHTRKKVAGVWFPGTTRFKLLHAQPHHEAVKVCSVFTPNWLSDIKFFSSATPCAPYMS